MLPIFDQTQPTRESSNSLYRIVFFSIQFCFEFVLSIVDDDDVNCVQRTDSLFERARVKTTSWNYQFSKEISGYRTRIKLRIVLLAVTRTFDYALWAIKRLGISRQERFSWDISLSTSYPDGSPKEYQQCTPWKMNSGSLFYTWKSRPNFANFSPKRNFQKKDFSHKQLVDRPGTTDSCKYICAIEYHK